MQLHVVLEVAELHGYTPRRDWFVDCAFPFQIDFFHELGNKLSSL